MNDPSFILGLGLRFHDLEIIKIAYKQMKKQRTTNGIDKLQLIYSQIAGYGPSLDEILRLETRPLTLTQQNAINFALTLAIALDKLENCADMNKQIENPH